MLERFHEWRRNRRRQPGLNTAADADRFVADIHAAEPVLAPEPADVPIEPTRTELDMATPVYDALWRETMARLTAERVDAAFAEMVADWRCENCRAGLHQDCPACTCPCSAVVDA
jgi:hypothetical protein